MKTRIKKIINLTGIEIKKYTAPNYKWIYDQHIEFVLDIGANTGQYAKSIDKILPGVKIYSFEPIKKCYDKLVENSVSLNLTAFNFALGEKEYETEINVSSHSPSSSLLEMADLHLDLFKFSNYQTSEKISVKTLDSIAPLLKLNDRNYIVKIDVQGFEDKVILGGYSTIKNARIIQIEMTYQELYKGQLLFEDLYALITKMDFAFAGNINQVYNPTDGKLIYSDSLFIKKDSYSASI